MFRTALFGLTAALGLALPAATPTAAAGAPDHHPIHHPPYRGCWKVLARGCDREPWRSYGEFRDEHQARHRARELNRHGLEAIVVRG